MENLRERTEYFGDQINQKTDIPNPRIWFPRTLGTGKTNNSNKKHQKLNNPRKPKKQHPKHTDKESRRKQNFL